MKDFETFIWILHCFSLFARLLCFIENEFIEGQAFPFHLLIYCVSMGSTFAKFSNSLLREGGWQKKGKGEGGSTLFSSWLWQSKCEIYRL